MKLADSPADQEILEDIVETTKPPIPPECEGLDYLLYTPFRYYGRYPRGSRFRKEGFSKGVFYGSRDPLTAIAETAFYRLLFYAESPGTDLPANPGEYTSFSVPIYTYHAIDLTGAPLNRDSELWTRLADYGPCQELTDVAREAGIQVICYQSVRDPRKLTNYAVLTCKAFGGQISQRQSWRIQLRTTSVWAMCESPKGAVEFDIAMFLEDPRLAPLRRNVELASAAAAALDEAVVAAANTLSTDGK